MPLFDSITSFTNIIPSASSADVVSSNNGSISYGISTNIDPGRMEAEVTDAVNAQRKRAGCAPVRYNQSLKDSAKQYSRVLDDKNIFSHTADGKTLRQRIRVGTKLGEVLAGGQSNGSAVVTGWMNSPPHRAILLDCSYNSAAFGTIAPVDRNPFDTVTTGHFAKI